MIRDRARFADQAATDSTLRASMSEWFEEWFGEEYLQLYPHRDDAEAERAVRLDRPATGLRAGLAGARRGVRGGAPRAGVSRAGARCVGLDLSVTLLRIARSVTDAPLVRADMRAPADPACLDGPHRQSVHQLRLLRARGRARRRFREMVSTLRPGGWFVIDFLNPAAVRRGLVPRETVTLDGASRCDPRSSPRTAIT